MRNSQSQDDAAAALPEATALSKVMAGCVALSAFAIAVIGGMYAANPASLILGRAVIAMVLCYPIGFIIGMACERVLREHIERYREQHQPTADELPEHSTNKNEPQKDEEIITV